MSSHDFDKIEFIGMVRTGTFYYTDFAAHYNIPACSMTTTANSAVNFSITSNLTNSVASVVNSTAPPSGCERDVSLLYLLLLLGTLWLGVTLYNFTMT